MCTDGGGAARWSRAQIKELIWIQPSTLSSQLRFTLSVDTTGTHTLPHIDGASQSLLEGDYSGCLGLNMESFSLKCTFFMIKCFQAQGHCNIEIRATAVLHLSSLSECCPDGLRIN